MHRLTLLLLLPLVACADPAQRCDRAVARELRTVNELIEETRVSLARGYTYETEYAPVRTGLVLCSGSRNVRFCSSNQSGVRREAVAVDPEAEQRKLDQLLNRREALRTRGTALCNAPA